MNVVECKLLYADEWVMINVDNVSMFQMEGNGSRLFFGSANHEDSVAVAITIFDLLQSADAAKT